MFMTENSKNGKKWKPVVLIVLDGWGLGEEGKGNAIAAAKLPTFKKINEYYPQMAIQASGISVGLPWGEPGNSEVGHMTLGSGKVIYQNMPRITMAIQDGEFYKNPVFLKAVENAKKNNSAIHLVGLVSKGSVHSNIDHLYALVEIMKYQKMEKVFLHIFTDGRDSAPTSGLESVRELETKLEKFGVGKIATISGRYFGMDRNNNWDRIQKAYDAMVNGIGEKTSNLEDYIKNSYKKEIFDEYLEPACFEEDGETIGRIQENDSVIFFNYREDRARQLTKSFVVPGFSKFPITNFKNLFFATMTQYEDNLPAEIAFPPIKITMCLGKVLSEHGLKQLRLAETEKFAHVTYFFNGGNEEPFPGEDRIIVPSKDTSDFSKVPEMSAHEITQKTLENLEKETYDFMLINFANADIVGHTGKVEAAVKAVETIDGCLEEIIKKVLSQGGCLLVTADHGNVEEMVNNHTGERDTEHSANPVPLWFITPENHRPEPGPERPQNVAGLLSDIAPTVLDILQIEKPKDMTGESLLEMFE
jgi:2,3-bisphosphoglycerate-independent phosphoglycerate mutase